ncbi:uncharacterized protein LOC133822569 [Humulus lupulus]|uniref:uncharacterized protein LOC133822569 n=1 Tax=Humulus lupulus TaxID=3486 RepID=UPI002B412D94|nr:uncharacterized protein LOC133822569 [Humulus lupulus]
MGSVISHAANGVGGLLGDAITAPFKTVFGRSCEDICSGPWDVICFIEHLCVSNLLRLLMILVLSYITLLFFYLLFKVGICQCIVKSLCKMCWAACEAYWYALEDITCFLWHKLMNTKRVNRRRRRPQRRRFHDIEQGYSTSDETDSSEYDNHHLVKDIRKNYSVKRGRRERFQNSSFRNSSGIGPSRSRHHHVNLKSREVSVHGFKGRSRRLRRDSRQLQSRKVRNVGREAKVFKKRRLR